MARQIDIEIPKDHQWPNFKWAKKPGCSCGRVIDAVEEKFLFVANFVEGEEDDLHAIFYMMPVNAQGVFARSSGIPVSHCPWCGDKILGLKK